MIKIGLYLYDGGKTDYKGEDLSKYVMQGFRDVEDLTEILDTSVVTLFGYNRKVVFPPSTKFIIEITEDTGVIKTLHRIVEQDTVERIILSETEETYKHTVSMIEPSAIAQHRICDNISATYKLKDVSLETYTAVDTEETNGFQNLGVPITPSGNFGQAALVQRGRYGKYFKFDEGDKIKIKLPGKDASDKKNHVISGTVQATIHVPKLKVYGGVEGATTYSTDAIGDVSIRCIVREYKDGERTTTAENTVDIISNSSLKGLYRPSFFQPADDTDSALMKEYLPEEVTITEYDNVKQYYIDVIRYTDTSKAAPTYDFSIDVKPGCQYEVSVSLLSVDPSLPADTYFIKYNEYTGDSRAAILDNYNFLGIFYKDVLSSTTYSQTVWFSFYHDATTTETFTSGEKYSALSLIEKSILNTGIYEKMDGVAVGDLAHRDSNGVLDYPCPFYIDPAWVPTLGQTDVVESFFSQKNLWEMCLTVGNYIHAIPKILFGENDKFMISFTPLGQTEVQADGNAVRQGVANYQYLSDYISETASYVDNLVQLGGIRTEWVPLKTEADSYTISNDTADIEVSGKMIELLSVKVRCANPDGYNISFGGATTMTINYGDEADATKYVFERNIYNVLSVIYTEIPNKGTALYYDLGKNRISGLTYRLPQANNNIISDYTGKKVIALAFADEKGVGVSWDANMKDKTSGYWTDIKMTDFIFEVSYRTKDSARVAHTRPDIRKYLLASKHDNYPVHQQFNNQQETLVDSNKFGQNIFGKLIKSGNNTYTISEIVKSPLELKQAGLVYRINDEIYYISKVVSTYYCSHVESTITLSKDYNELSKVVGIPSEPRFYEISEQSSIRREVSINDFLMISTDASEVEDEASGFLMDTTPIGNYLGIYGGAAGFPKYAMSVFRGDADAITNPTFGEATEIREVIVPINTYVNGNTLTFEWDMLDNFGAGEKVVTPESDFQDKTVDGAYKTMRAVRYTDKFGKATLFDFFILPKAVFSLTPSSYEIPVTSDNVYAFPESPFSSDKNSGNFVGNYSVYASNARYTDAGNRSKGICLIKDCREACSFNYNLMAVTGSDTFVTSPYLFDGNRSSSFTFVALLTEEVNKLSDGFVNTSIVKNVFSIQGGGISAKNYRNRFGRPARGWIVVKISTILENADMTSVKSIALIADYNSNNQKQKLVLARNLPSVETTEEKIRDWYIGGATEASLKKHWQGTPPSSSQEAAKST